MGALEIFPKSDRSKISINLNGIYWKMTLQVEFIASGSRERRK